MCSLSIANPHKESNFKKQKFNCLDEREGFPLLSFRKTAENWRKRMGKLMTTMESLHFSYCKKIPQRTRPVTSPIIWLCLQRSDSSCWEEVTWRGGSAKGGQGGSGVKRAGEMVADEYRSAPLPLQPRRVELPGRQHKDKLSWGEFHGQGRPVIH